MLIDASVARARIFRSAFAIAALALIAACGGDSGSPVAPGPPPPPPPPPAPPPPPSVPFSGSYTLYSITDTLLPVLVPFPQSDHIQVDSGAMRVNDDMSYSFRAMGRTGFGVGSPITTVDTGTFTESGSTISFTSKFLHGIVYTGTATDTSLDVGLQGSLVASTVFTIPMYFLKEH